MTFNLEAARSWGKNSERNYDRLKERGNREKNERLQNRAYTRGRDAYSYGQRREKSVQPNIIFIVTDDQDEVLGLYTVRVNNVKLRSFWMPENFAVIHLKFKLKAQT